MSAYTHDCPPIDTCGPCGTLPAGFVRLRYFFGKRMGVADFVDEQRYHSGKQRFHNQRLHGAGVLCGLAVRRQSATDAVLRVGRGAALDACGREIVIGYEQCIDLEAWYARVAEERRRTVNDWPLPALDGGRLRLVVALRFAECGMGPEPAPRDACECDAAGCDFGRVREEFELQMFTADTPEVQGATPLTPGREMLERVVGRATGPSSLHRGLADAASVSCPDPDADGWLVLADLSFGFSTPPSATSIGVIDLATITVAARTTLLAETALLQELLLRALGAQMEAGMLNDGPEITALGITTGGAPATHRFTLALSDEVVTRTLPANAFTLTRWDPGAVLPAPLWTPQSVTTGYTAGTATTPPLIHVELPTAFLVVGATYRLALDTTAVPRSRPIVDADLRPLRPLRPALQFTLAEPTPGNFELYPAPYAR